MNQLAQLEDNKQTDYIQQQILDLKNIEALCTELLKHPHYAAMGKPNIIAIIQKAQALGVNVLEALNGSMYVSRGKVEILTILMAQLIRQKGHSITQSTKSTDDVCILCGRRIDNGDVWTASFSIQEAKQAGIWSAKNGWSKFPKDMLYSRALSRLARQLFPDVIGNCYVEKEISESPSLDPRENAEEVNTIEDTSPDVPPPLEDTSPDVPFPLEDTSPDVPFPLEDTSPDVPFPLEKTITFSQFETLDLMIGDNDELRERVMSFTKKYFGITHLEDLPARSYELVFDKLKKS